MDEPGEVARPTVPPAETVVNLIEQKTKLNPGKRAELLARAQILRPLLEDPNKLGLTDSAAENVRQYARLAGEKARRETEASIKDNPIEVVDDILFDLASETSEYRRWELQNTSYQLHEFQRSLQDQVTLYQQQRQLEGESTTFDEALEAKLGNVQSFQIELGHPAQDITEQMLKRLGALAPDQNLQMLKNSSKWQKSDRLGNKHVWTGEGTFVVEGGFLHLGQLKTSVPGLSVGIMERKDYETNYGTKYDLMGVLDREAVRRIVKAPSIPSPFSVASSLQPVSSQA